MSKIWGSHNGVVEDRRYAVAIRKRSPTRRRDVVHPSSESSILGRESWCCGCRITEWN